MAGFKKDWEEK